MYFAMCPYFCPDTIGLSCSVGTDTLGSVKAGIKIWVIGGTGLGTHSGSEMKKFVNTAGHVCGNKFLLA